MGGCIMRAITLLLVLVFSVALPGCSDGKPTTASSPSPASASPAATSMASTTPSSVAATPTTPSAATSPVPSATTNIQPDELRALFDKAASTRKLSIRSEVKQSIIRPEQVRAYLEKELEEENDPAQRESDQALFVLLDQIDAGEDLYEITLGLLSEQVAGFYRDDTKELFVVASAGQVGELETVTLIHEYVHALQDQQFDLKAMKDKAEKDGDGDQQLALQALYEGDATLAMAQYMLQSMTVAQVQELMKQTSEADSSKLQSAPWMMQVSMLFPYQQGANFAANLYKQGGWPAVDKAYVQPPVSTEQILHPSKYQAGEKPEEVDLPDLVAGLGADWAEIDEDVLGELELLAYLSQYVDADLASRAAEGWDGDRYAVLQEKSGGYAVAILTNWDSLQDATEFFDTYLEYMKGKGGATLVQDQPSRRLWSGAKRGVVVSIHDDEVLLVIADDEETSQRIAAQFTGF